MINMTDIYLHLKYRGPIVIIVTSKLLFVKWVKYMLGLIIQ